MVSLVFAFILHADDTCSKPLLRGYIGYSVNASSVYLNYAAENVPYGTLFEDRPNLWRPAPDAAMAVFRVSGQIWHVSNG